MRSPRMRTSGEFAAFTALFIDSPAQRRQWNASPLQSSIYSRDRLRSDVHQHDFRVGSYRVLSRRIKDFVDTRAVYRIAYRPNEMAVVGAVCADRKEDVMDRINPRRIAALAVAWLALAGTALGDETCNSPYMSKFIKGQEDFVYVWTLGVEGLGDGSDKLVTVDAEPEVEELRQSDPCAVGRRRGEAHHMGFTDDRRHHLGGRARRQPDLRVRYRHRSRETEAGADHRRPGRQGRLSRAAHLLRASRPDARRKRSRIRRTRAAAPAWRCTTTRASSSLPTPMPTEGGGDGYGYDLAVNPKKNALLTSSFTGHTNYMRPLGELIKDARGDEAIRQHDGRCGT